jgi:ABC-type transporter MlaC component
VLFGTKAETKVLEPHAIFRIWGCLLWRNPSGEMIRLVQKLAARYCFAGALATLILPAFAQTKPSVEAFVAKLDNAIRNIHQNSKKDSKLVDVGCRELLNEILDLNTMAQAAYVEVWERMTPPQRDIVRAAFEQRLISNCIRQFEGYEGDSLQLAGVRTTADGDQLATIRVGSQDDGKLVTWRLHSFGPANLRAIDVISDGRSVVIDARNEVAAVLQSGDGDIEALIAFSQK